MEKLLVRKDDYLEKSQKLKQLTDEQLKQRFWDLAEAVVEPLMEMATNYTTPAIERSVLLRMGFSSLEAKVLVEQVINYGLIGKGAGHVIYQAAKLFNCSIREAGLKLIEMNEWQEILTQFGVSE
jgi:D-ornithine 4,5-aminomutase subunit alpha